MLVHGALGDHRRWNALRPYLEPTVTVYALDRRGRGASADSPHYHVKREFEDVAAVVDVIAGAFGASVAVLGNSYGGLVAFGAAQLTANIDRLILYEGWPPVDADAFVPPPQALRRLEALLAAGDREGLLETTYRELLHVSEEQLDAFRARPSWCSRVASAHTIPRELRAFREAAFDPRQAATISAATLLLIGEDSPGLKAQAAPVAAALPDARLAVLPGQGHLANILAPRVFAERVLAFLQDKSSM